MGPEIGEIEVTRHKESLVSTYPTVTVVNQERKVDDELFAELKQYSRDGYPELKDYSEDGYIGASYALVVRSNKSSASKESDSEQSALLVLTHDNEKWDVPGGGREEGESFEETAIREVQEETGIHCQISDCQLIEHRVTVADGHPERLHTLWTYFLGEYVNGSIIIKEDELNGGAWFSTFPERISSATAQFGDWGSKRENIDD